METNITQEVYDLLEDRTDSMRSIKGQYKRALENSQSKDYTMEARGRYSAEASQLKHEIEQLSDRAIMDAKKLVSEYREKVESGRRLDPEKITDEIKLLQPGIILKERDIESLLERVKGNQTMEQIIMRYAEEHEIQPKGWYMDYGRQEKELADSIDYTLDIYRKWISGDSASQMLKTFFNVM